MANTFRANTLEIQHKVVRSAIGTITSLTEPNDNLVINRIRMIIQIGHPSMIWFISLTFFMANPITDLFIFIFWVPRCATV